MSRTPCYNCEDRTDHCHGECERYREWSAKHAEELERIRKERQVDQAIYAYRDEGIHKVLKGRGKR